MKHCHFNYGITLHIVNLLLIFSILNFQIDAFAQSTYAFSANDYKKQQFLDQESINFISNDNYVKGIGTIEYEFIVTNADAGWYELWLHAADWPTDIYLDNTLLAHTSLQSDNWVKNGNLQKVLNVNLVEGKHSLRFGRLYHPGLPYIHTVILKPSTDISGRVHTTPETDRLVFRRNEDFMLNLAIGSSLKPTDLTIGIRNASTSTIIDTIKIPSTGATSHSQTIRVPTDSEGVFDLEIKDPITGYVDRVMQYVVVDTHEQLESSVSQVSKQLVAEIDPLATPPDYSSTHIGQSGADYISGSSGVYDNSTDPDYFAFKLNLPDKHSLYLVEVDYPDDEKRAFTISLVDEAVSPYAMDSGVVTGGRLPLSKTVQMTQLYFYARTVNPRLLFLNWHSNQNISIRKIRIYKITSPLPPLLDKIPERKFGTFWEESLRFTTYFGAEPHSTEWSEIKKTAERWAEWSKFIGSNVWMPSIANYQSMMWPSQVLPGYAPAEEDGFGLIGPPSLKDPMQKDIIRLLLLVAEKNNISFIGELNIQMLGFIQKGLDLRFGGKGDISLNSVDTPWLIVSDDGKIGGQSGFDPYLNPVHPAVQQWIKDVFSELANRYKDSPAFDGLAMRLMDWAFPSWQAFPSIHWGYGDYTMTLFEKDTGIKVPVSAEDPVRFKKRFDWLTKNHYNQWVTWRCTKIYQLHHDLSQILQKARPDLKLYINTYGPDYSQSDWGKHGGWNERAKKIKRMGWENVIKESGIDPVRYNDSAAIIFSNSYFFEPGVRATGATSMQQEEVEWQEAHDPAAILATTKTNAQGGESSVNFIHYYMEYDFPVKSIGYDRLLSKNSEQLRIVGLLDPPGKLVLNKYLNAMAEGNITFMTDGGLGYILGQPDQLRPFLKEYLSLPKIRMSKLSGTGKYVSLWHGNRNSEIYFYIINKSNEPVGFKIFFSKQTACERISTGDAIDANNIIMPPYSLIAIRNTVANSIPVSITAPNIIKITDRTNNDISEEN